VRNVIDEMRTRELPGVTGYRVHEHFIDSFVAKWENLSLEAFREVEKIFKSVCSTLVEKRFGRFKTSTLLYEAR
jgi:hypothetical protein